MLVISLKCVFCGSKVNLLKGRVWLRKRWGFGVYFTDSKCGSEKVFSSYQFLIWHMENDLFKNPF